MIFNGAPSFVASMKKDSAFGQVIEFKDDGKVAKVVATGTPAAAGPWGEIATNAEEAKPVEGKDMGGRAYLQRNWYNAETKTYTTRFNFIVEGNELMQFRSMTPDGKLFLRAEMKKPDQSMMWFEATLKKTA